MTRRSLLSLFAAAPLVQGAATHLSGPPPLPASGVEIARIDELGKLVSPWPIELYWTLPDPSDSIVGMLPWQDLLFVYTRRSIYLLEPQVDRIQLVQYRQSCMWDSPPALGEVRLW